TKDGIRDRNVTGVQTCALPILLQCLTLIVCVGKTLEKREANETFTHIKEKVKAALESLKTEQIKETIIAYEPIWAIGTGKTATSAQANEVCKHIRNVVRDLTNEDVAQQIV